MNSFRHLGVNAVAGDGEAVPPVAVDEVQREYRAVPQVFRVPELLQVRPEVFQEVVAGPGGNTGHGGVGKARQAVGHLGDGAVPAAGVDSQCRAALRQAAGHLRGAAGPVRQHAGAVQPVKGAQAVRHLVDTGGLVPFPRAGVDNEDVTHGQAPFCLIILCIILSKNYLPYRNASHFSIPL